MRRTKSRRSSVSGAQLAAFYSTGNESRLWTIRSAVPPKVMIKLPQGEECCLCDGSMVNAILLSPRSLLCRRDEQRTDPRNKLP